MQYSLFSKLSYIYEQMVPENSDYLYVNTNELTRKSIDSLLIF